MDKTALLSRREAHDFEAKSAQGRFGDGTVPDSVWETYVAMANTEGGLIVLGAEEKPDGSFNFIGIGDPHKLQRNFWNSVNNKETVSANILRNQDVQITTIEGKKILAVDVPRAARRYRPVYVGPNPLTGTYRRDYEGDYRCDEPTVRRMMAEATQDSRDVRLLEGFSMDDIDEESLSAYRNQFRSTKPGHPWLSLDDDELLRQLGGWKKDRRTGHEGLTVAGVLMFGHLRSILDAMPNYLLDYQERPTTGHSEIRWTDRVTTDGTWSGNLFDFYRRVYPKLTADLKVPFRLEQSHKRIDETPVHEAIREALVNTLIHADYEGRVGIQILKFPNRFRFRNPGVLRIAPEDVKAGGISDCRNRTLQTMFQMIGAGEKAGSGFPRILTAWRQQHWREPDLKEFYDNERTELTLTLASLIPEPVMEALMGYFGRETFKSLPEVKRLALAVALDEGEVTNARLCELTDKHSRDITFLLRDLVDDGFLESEGKGRGTYYVLAGHVSEIGPLFGAESFQHLSSSTPDKAPSTPDKAPSTPDKAPSTPDKNKQQQHEETHQRLLQIGQPIRNAKRSNPDEVRATILALCEKRYLRIDQLVEYLGRQKSTLRDSYLNPMVRQGKLTLRYPDRVTHPKQAYKTIRPS